MKEDPMEKKEGCESVAGEATGYSRRSILLGSAALIAGGLTCGITAASAVTEPAYAPAPPLPWKWPKLDPLEAGTRAYENYLKNKG
jgi:hypothetical protein